MGLTCSIRFLAVYFRILLPGRREIVATSGQDPSDGVHHSLLTLVHYVLAGRSGSFVVDIPQPSQNALIHHLGIAQCCSHNVWLILSHSVLVPPDLTDPNAEDERGRAVKARGETLLVLVRGGRAGSSSRMRISRSGLGADLALLG